MKKQSNLFDYVWVKRTEFSKELNQFISTTIKMQLNDFNNATEDESYQFNQKNKAVACPMTLELIDEPKKADDKAKDDSNLFNAVHKGAGKYDVIGPNGAENAEPMKKADAQKLANELNTK